MAKYWLGKKRAELTNKKISLTLKKKGIKPPSRKGIPAWNKGKIFKDLRGQRNPRWKGGTVKWFKREARIRDDYVCQVCSLREPDIMEVDHILPVCKGGSDDLANLMTICPNCHRRRTNLLLKEIYTGKSNNQRKNCSWKS